MVLVDDEDVVEVTGEVILFPGKRRERSGRSRRRSMETARSIEGIRTKRGKRRLGGVGVRGCRRCVGWNLRRLRGLGLVLKSELLDEGDDVNGLVLVGRSGGTH